MKLHRHLGVSRPTAWFILRRIREGWKRSGDCDQVAGPVRVDETYFGGKRKNMRNARRKRLTGRGPVGKMAVVRAKDRATNQVAGRAVASTEKGTLQGFVKALGAKDASVYTDEARACETLPFTRESVKHSVSKYVRGKAHTNGVESFRATLKRAHEGMFHELSPKHLNRYVTEFGGMDSARDSETLAQMTPLVAGLLGKRLMYRNLIADNGLPSGARS